MRAMVVVVLILFFIVVAGVLYYSLNHQHHHLHQQNVPASHQQADHKASAGWSIWKPGISL